MEAESPETWRKTELWRELDNRKGVAGGQLRHIVESILPDAEKVLNKGDTMPGNFTLHDADHSYRVAEWMAEIAGDLLTDLSVFDLGMLLLSAYLHDIGMTPKMGKLRAHHDFLLSGQVGELGEDEIGQLQACLDDHWKAIEPPLADGRPTTDDLRLVDLVLAGYVRQRHNDWSESWMREEIPNRIEQPYPGWLDDLVRLCRSHHYGVEQLKSADFDPRLVGAPATVLHLRYCACLLRIADVVDFDPERTPPILFAHRDIEGESAVYWHKDQGVSLLKQDDHLLLDARPANAVTHNAIATTVEGIDRELLLVRQLDDETDFRTMNGKRDLPHHWTLDTHVKAVIVPRENAYEYVDGTFKPDANRLLELLGGVELYGSKLAAVRELLQNAFDAVREQIALQRLGEEEPASEPTHARIAAVHKVTLVLERVDQGLRLTCRDSGIGMSREIITNRLLIGGTTAGHDTRALERECRARGFSVGRTARFGIGVLSYFLIADRMAVRSRRSQEARDPDGTGWSFVTLGLTDFGELRRDPECKTGTTIELDLKSFEDDNRFAQELRNYLAFTIRRTPCAFSFSAPDFDLDPLRFDSGWTEDDDGVKAAVTEADWIDDEVAEALTLETHDGELPDELGTFRISFGTFPTVAGPSYAFMKLEGAPEGNFLVEPVGNGHGTIPEYSMVHSWNGMRIRPEVFSETASEFKDLAQEVHPAYVEIDWADDRAGDIAIHRSAFHPGEAAAKALRVVVERVEQIADEFLSRHRESPLALLNAQLLVRLPGQLQPHWLRNDRDDSGRGILSRLELPVVTPIEDIRLTGERWRGRKVEAPAEFNLQSTSYHSDEYNWYGTLYHPQFVAAHGEKDRTQPVVIWESFEPGTDAADEELFRTAEFPPEWSDLVGIDALAERIGGVVWNAGHPLVRAADATARRWVRESFVEVENFDLDSYRDLLLESPALLAAWVLTCIEEGEEEDWNSAEGQNRGLIEAIWSAVPELGQCEKLVYIDYGFRIERIHTLTTSTWTTRYGEHLGLHLIETLGTPGENWRLMPPEPELD